MEGTLLSLNCQIKMRYSFIKTLFIEEPERDVKEGSVYYKSLYRAPLGNREVGYFTRKFER